MSTAIDTPQSSDLGEITLSLRDHHIAFTLPYGARFDGQLLLPCGALIHGDFVGDLFCETGSVLIKKGARFSGQIEADNIYIEGEVLPVSDKKRSIVVARSLVAGSSSSRINADIYSPSFAVHKSKIWGSLHTLEEAAEVRKSNRAHAETAIEPKSLADASRNG